MHIFKESMGTKEIGLMKAVPKTIVCGEKQPPKWICDGAGGKERTLIGGCLHCNNPRCYRFNAFQISSEISSFSFDRDKSVCPVGAISWDSSSNTPSFDNQKCIKCGVCSRMCPVGAIFYDGNRMVVNKNDSINMVPDTSSNVQKQEAQLNKVEKAARTGCIIKGNNTVMRDVYSHMDKLSGNTPNMVTRNLLIALGNRCAMSRVGDVYTRLDVLIENRNNKQGVVEVEFGRDTLEAARGILDDIAVANCRYGIPKNDNMALAVCLRLPNERQGYWQVIKDIKKVEGISINTITVGALLLLLWEFKTLDIADSSFYADFDNMSIRSAVKKILGNNNVNISYRELGILEPEK